MSVCPTNAEGATTPRGTRGACTLGEVSKSIGSKMPVPAFRCEILCMERVRNEEKINETRPSLMTIPVS
jgi:hypothetical protein